MLRAASPKPSPWVGPHDAILHTEAQLLTGMGPVDDGMLTSRQWPMPKVTNVCNFTCAGWEPLAYLGLQGPA